VQLRLAGAARHHRGLAAARRDDVGDRRDPVPPDRAVRELSTTSAMWGSAGPLGRPVDAPLVSRRGQSGCSRLHGPIGHDSLAR
jgi:hypothetical protein